MTDKFIVSAKTIDGRMYYNAAVNSMSPCRKDATKISFVAAKIVMAALNDVRESAKTGEQYDNSYFQVIAKRVE